MNFEHIASHASVKRGIELAVAGRHGLMLAGPRGSGRDTLGAAFKTLYERVFPPPSDPVGPEDVEAISKLRDYKEFSRFITAWGLCGCGGGLSRGCICSQEGRMIYRLKQEACLQEMDMVLEVAGVPFQELVGPDRGRSTMEEAFQRIIGARGLLTQLDTSVPLNVHSLFDAAAKRTFELGVRKLALGVGPACSVLKVSWTISCFEGGSKPPATIKAKHVAEALMYRSLPQQPVSELKEDTKGVMVQ